MNGESCCQDAGNCIVKKRKEEIATSFSSWLRMENEYLGFNPSSPSQCRAEALPGEIVLGIHDLKVAAIFPNHLFAILLL
jgi:hypothetical protein